MLQEFVDHFFGNILSKRIANKGLIFSNGYFEPNHNAKKYDQEAIQDRSQRKEREVHPLYPREDEQSNKDAGARGIENHRRLGHGGEANQGANQAHQRQHIPESPLVIKRVGKESIHERCMHNDERCIAIEWCLSCIGKACSDITDKDKFVFKKLLEIPAHLRIVEELEQLVQRHTRKVITPFLHIGHKRPSLRIDRNDNITCQCTAREGGNRYSVTPVHRDGLPPDFDRIEPYRQ